MPAAIPKELIHHSDRGSQPWTQGVLATPSAFDAGIETSVGSVGDSYENVLAESIYYQKRNDDNVMAGLN